MKPALPNLHVDGDWELLPLDLLCWLYYRGLRWGLKHEDTIFQIAACTPFALLVVGTMLGGIWYFISTMFGI